MSQPPDDDDTPALFPDADGGAPPRDRDLEAEIRTAVYALPDGEAVDLHHLSDEIRSVGGYVAEGVLSATVDRMVNAGTIALVLLGDPSRAHFRKPRAAVDPGLMRAVCMELVRLPDARAPSVGAMGAFQIAEAMARRTGGDYSADSIEPALFSLMSMGVLEAHLVDGPDPDPEAGKFTVYAMAPAVLYNLLAPGLDTMIAPVTGGDGAVAASPAQGNNGDATGNAAAVAAMVASRMADAEKTLKAEKAARNKAEKRAAGAEAALGRAKAYLEEKGLLDVFDEAVADKPAAAPLDERGKPIRYEKRVPVNAELRAAFWVESCALAEQAEKHEAALKTSKEAHDRVKAETAENLSLIKAQLANMRAADRDGKYLLVVPAAYKVFDPETRRTGIYEYDSRRFVCWEDLGDLKPGTQATLPGLDAPIVGPVDPDAGDAPSSDGDADTGDAAGTSSDGGDAPKSPKPPKPRKPRGAPKPSSEPAEDAAPPAPAPDAAAEDAAKADAAAAIKPTVVGPLRIAEIKPVIVNLVKSLPRGIVWKGTDAQVTVAFLEALAGAMGQPGVATLPSTPVLVTGAVEALLRGRALAAVDDGAGWVLYHPENGDPTQPPADPGDKPAPKPKRGKGRKPTAENADDDSADSDADAAE